MCCLLVDSCEVRRGQCGQPLRPHGAPSIADGLGIIKFNDKEALPTYRVVIYNQASSALRRPNHGSRPGLSPRNARSRLRLPMDAQGRPHPRQADLALRRLRRRYTPDGAYRRPGPGVKAQALETYLEGATRRGIGRILGYSATAVSGWVKKGGSKT